MLRYSRYYFGNGNRERAHYFHIRYFIKPLTPANEKFETTMHKKKRIIHNSISRDRGKTGALRELSVPLEVAAGITNYEIVREHFLKDLAQDPQHPFFVDHKGTPLKL